MGRIDFHFLGKHENRWRVRVELDFAPEAMTIGLVSEDGKPLGPAMVAPPDGKNAVIAELSGPCQLPAGAVVRCVVDTHCGCWMQEFPVDERRGIHAFLMGDTPLVVESEEKGVGLELSQIRKLSQSFSWLKKEKKKAARWEPASAEQDLSIPLAAQPCCEDDLLRMLQEDFGVEGDEEELLRSLRSAG